MEDKEIELKPTLSVDKEGDSECGREGESLVEEAIEENEDDKVPSPGSEKPRQWLYDRCNGKSRYGSSRPPLPIFYVPFPVKIWPDILEQNCLCERLGNIGIIHPEAHLKARRRLLLLGLVSNILSFILTLYTGFALVNDCGWITASSMSSAVITCDEQIVPTIYLAIGLRAVALQNWVTVGTDIVRFSDFCELVGAGLFQYIEPDHCDYCEGVSLVLSITLFLSLLGYIPTLLTDVLRLYPNYDVNCQKVFASFFSLFSLAMAIRTWKHYENNCFYEFYQGEKTFPVNGTELGSFVPPEWSNGTSLDVIPETVLIHFDWHKGAGLLALQIGALLKVVDIIVNVLIPTPTITRDHDEQAAYEALAEQQGDEPSESALSTAAAHVSGEDIARTRRRTATEHSWAISDHPIVISTPDPLVMSKPSSLYDEDTFRPKLGNDAAFGDQSGDHNAHSDTTS